MTIPGLYDEGPVSCASSAGGEQDAWSKALDCLDAITTSDMVCSLYILKIHGPLSLLLLSTYPSCVLLWRGPTTQFL